VLLKPDDKPLSFAPFSIALLKVNGEAMVQVAPKGIEVIPMKT